MNARFGPSVFDKARGKWKGILLQLGVEGKYLSGKHGPCPQCGGHDRFRYTDHGGEGSSICNQCGSLTGMQLLMSLRGWEFKVAAREVEAVLGDVSNDPAKPQIDPEKRRKLLRETWGMGLQVQNGDPVDAYLSKRGCGEVIYPKSLRYVPALPYTSAMAFDAMIARVEDHEGKPLNIHRTYLQNGDKAPVDTPRKMMPGAMNGHGAVRLAEAGEVLGIAEGIETALSACGIFTVPTWAALNAGSLAAFQWPEGVKELVIFGDNDASYTGQAAAYQLAKKARSKGLEVSVHIPEITDTDWADYSQIDKLKEGAK